MGTSITKGSISPAAQMGKSRHRETNDFPKAVKQISGRTGLELHSV